jgi:hypothetical protein
MRRARHASTLSDLPGLADLLETPWPRVITPATARRLAAVAARRDRQELDFLRKQARELDLPFPGDDA